MNYKPSTLGVIICFWSLILSKHIIKISDLAAAGSQEKWEFIYSTVVILIGLTLVARSIFSLRKFDKTEVLKIQKPPN